MPYIAQVALRKKNSLTIFGGDYDTVDGTGNRRKKIIKSIHNLCNVRIGKYITKEIFLGVRDFIHIMDLASGHIAALKKLQEEHLTLKVRENFNYFWYQRIKLQL